MKNPFVKQNNTALIALGITGAAAAGAIAYLYLTDSGNNTRNKISDSVSGEIDKLAKTFKNSFKDRRQASSVIKPTFQKKRLRQLQIM
ncbi:hypothetical protein HK413_09700 [Mucilaginibacter sp. S1162]|uniref:YtxH domain-containing protein n=1 Tax=Mucilaginibacter humi TaxID=2732510 RepID=A0ABX1W2D6_9SPHI|nr:YtxH domain-containing protein [Mucilaginibacter humi]NNU34348.1 hypothetical protein [Mucilaginibacter humi]